MNIERYLGVLEALDGEVEPAFGVAFAIGAGAVTSGPQAVLVMVCFDGFGEVARVEVAVEDNLVPEVVEFEGVLMREVGRLVQHHSGFAVLYFQ